jgi:hypothetical protein
MTRGAPPIRSYDKVAKRLRKSKARRVFSAGAGEAIRTRRVIGVLRFKSRELLVTIVFHAVIE